MRKNVAVRPASKGGSMKAKVSVGLAAMSFSLMPDGLGGGRHGVEHSVELGGADCRGDIVLPDAAFAQRGAVGKHGDAGFQRLAQLAALGIGAGGQHSI